MPQYTHFVPEGRVKRAPCFSCGGVGGWWEEWEGEARSCFVSAVRNGIP